MFNLEEKHYGYKMTFDGSVSADEMQQWVDASKRP